MFNVHRKGIEAHADIRSRLLVLNAGYVSFGSGADVLLGLAIRLALGIHPEAKVCDASTKEFLNTFTGVHFCISVTDLVYGVTFD